jgi:guanylate kinase
MKINKGNLYVIAAPSGAGKTTLTRALVESVPDLVLSISHTTREKRPHEIDGVNYFFINTETFETLITQQAFLEYATIFDHLYGTSKQVVEATLQKGIDVILEIDWQGHRQIKKIFPDTIGIFVLPPSLQDLYERLTKRNQDAQSIIKKRIEDVKETVGHIHEFDYIVMNDEFARALTDVKNIILAGRLVQRKQCIQYEALIKSLIEM